MTSHSTSLPHSTSRNSVPAGHNLSPTKTRLPPPHPRPLPTCYGTPAHRFCRVMIRAEAASRRQQKNKPSYVELQTQSSEKLPSSQEDTWFEIKEIVGEKKNSYRIAWAGEDPATGQPWKREWVCATPQLTIPVGLRLTGVCNCRS